MWSFHYKDALFLQVSYCENDVDCRRLLQLIHFGEMFDASLCAKTCDNCLKELRWVEKDVTNTAREMVSGWMCDLLPNTFRHLSVNLQFSFVACLGWAGYNGRAVTFILSHSWSLQRVCEPKCMCSDNYSRLVCSDIFFSAVLPSGATVTATLLC